MADIVVKDQLTHFKASITDLSGYRGGDLPSGAGSRGLQPTDYFYGLVTGFTPPPLTVRKLEMPIGGDSMPWADGGLEPLTVGFVTRRYVGALDALFMHEATFTFNGALVTGATARRIQREVSGTVTVVTPGESAPNTPPPYTLEIDAYAYKVTEISAAGASTVHVDINTRTMKRIIDGVDQLAHVRVALGMSGDAAG